MEFTDEQQYQLRLLAKAIREGCKVSQPNRYRLFEGPADKLRACALGAALLGIGIVYTHNKDLYEDLGDIFPVLITHPMDGDKSDLLDLILDFNDDYKLSREEIADRIEQQNWEVK